MRNQLSKLGHWTSFPQDPRLHGLELGQGIYDHFFTACHAAQHMQKLLLCHSLLEWHNLNCFHTNLSQLLSPCLLGDLFIAVNLSVAVLWGAASIWYQSLIHQGSASLFNITIRSIPLCQVSLIKRRSYLRANDSSFSLTSYNLE